MKLEREQLKITTETEHSLTICAFTGHRDLEEDFSEEKLSFYIEQLILKGVSVFYNGMAKGFDLISAEILLSLKKKYKSVKLIACIPFYGQEKYFTDQEKKRYAKVLKKADEKILLSETYYKGCLLVRDKYMAERADCLITYCKKDTGGTAYTVNCFKKLHPFAPIYYV